MKPTTIEPLMNDVRGQFVSKTQTTEKWEIKEIGQFLLRLQDTNVLYYVEGHLALDKAAMCKEFHEYIEATNKVGLKAKFEAKRGPHLKIGQLLAVTGFLKATPRSSKIYHIKAGSFKNFRKNIIYEFDCIQRHGGRIPNNNSNDDNNIDNVDINVKQLTQAHTIDTSQGSIVLQYEGSQTLVCDPDFVLTSVGCIICQQNFDRIYNFEEHVEYHGDNSNFKSLESMEKLSSSMFKLSYQLCVNSHMFGFTLQSETLDNLIIVAIVIIRPRSFHLVNYTQMPYNMPSKGQYIFFVDSDLFKLFLEQPIVIVFRLQDNNNDKYHVEQHHFKRIAPFPKVHFAVHSHRLPNTMHLKQTKILKSYLPPNKFIRGLMSNCNNNNLLFTQSQDFRKYFEQQKCLTLQNMPGAIMTMLQVEDVEILNIYRKMTLTNVHLHQFGRDVSVKLRSTTNAINEANLSLGDEVIMIVEQKNDRNETITNEYENIDMILKSKSQICEESKKNKKQIFFGIIDLVTKNRASVKCEMKLPVNCIYTIIFRPMRFVLRQQYRALNQLVTFNHSVLKRFLFPEIDRTMKPLADLYNLELFDRTIYGNPEQLNAVKQIAMSNNLQIPFILYGPPGTGKTSTLVESIMQLFIQRSDTRILVMAGSNGACDEIALRLLRLIAKTPLSDNKALTRIYSRSSDRRSDNIDDTLLEYSNMYSIHFYPHVSILHGYRIVVCTLSVSGKLSLGGFGKCCENNEPIFTHIFVDEAAASSEAETLMGITCAISPRATLIVSGDHKQLGAILQSNRAINLGLGVSLMERLLKRECYQADENGEYNRNVQSRLRQNYRSHPEIVKLYSELYYEGQLIALASKDEVNLCEKWYKMPNKNFPIIFHAVFGTVYKSSNSVSLHNVHEINAVMSYVKEFMFFGINGKRLKESDIGIISPYKNQYTRIQEQLNIRNWHQIECGSVETFQGKEKPIIIVSFVRSFSEHLGFLVNPRRLNVALSRPKSLLILIGNPNTLSLNNDFKSIIDTCKREGSFVGASLYEDKDKNALTTAFNGMKISNTADTTNNKSSHQKTITADALAQSTKLCTSSKISSSKTIEKDTFILDKFFERLPRVPNTLCFDNNTCKAIVTPSFANIDNRTTENEVMSTDVVVPSNKEISKAKLTALPATIDSRTVKNGIMTTAATNPLQTISDLSKATVSSIVNANVESKTVRNNTAVVVASNKEPSKVLLSATPANIDSKIYNNGIMNNAATNQRTTTALLPRIETSKPILTSSANVGSKTVMNTVVAIPPNKEACKAILSSSPTNVNKTAKNTIMETVDTNPLTTTAVLPRMKASRALRTSSSIHFESKIVLNTAVAILSNKEPSKVTLTSSPANEPSKAVLTSSTVNVESKTIMNTTGDVKSNRELPSNTILIPPLVNVANNNVSSVILATNIGEHVDIHTMRYNPSTWRNVYDIEQFDSPFIQKKKSKKSCVLQ